MARAEVAVLGRMSGWEGAGEKGPLRPRPGCRMCPQCARLWGGRRGWPGEELWVEAVQQRGRQSQTDGAHT